METATGLERYGGARRDRAADLYNAIVALSQLSYDPERDAASRKLTPEGRGGEKLGAARQRGKGNFHTPR